MKQRVQARCDRSPMSRMFRDSRFVDFNAGTTKIPPMLLLHFLRRPLQFSDKVMFFQCRIEVWNLGVAVQILKEIESSKLPSTWSHAAYGMLAIGFAYFEMIGKTLNPNSGPTKTSGADFNYGFCDVYQEYMPASGICDDHHVPDAVKQFRNRVRNGIYHLAWTKKDLLIHNDPLRPTKDFDVEQRNIHGQSVNVYILNPHSMVHTIVDHFPTFIQRLEDPDARYDGMRRKFEEFVDTFHEP